MSNRARRVGSIVAASVAALGVSAAVAGAATPSSTPPTLAGIQAKAAAAVSLRVDDLNAATSKVQGDTRLGADGGALASYLQAGIAPLQALGQKIAGDTTEGAAATDYSTIFTNFRVLALVLPAARLAGSADVLQNTTIPKLTTLSTKAASRVDATNAAVLQPLIDDLNAQITDASQSTAGIAATVLAYTPAQWNTNHDLLVPARGADQAADANIAKARADLKQIATDLKGAAPTSTPTTAA
jgi:hypothetical protein